MIHCEKSTCKYWCEDICTIDLNGGMVYVDSNGECENYEEGKCDWYEIAEKCNGECEGCSVEGCQPNKNLIKTIWSWKVRNNANLEFREVGNMAWTKCPLCGEEYYQVELDQSVCHKCEDEEWNNVLSEEENSIND